jgi:hypothetical protein
LIMVVAFVGFVGGWARQVLGPEALFLGGALAATVVSWFTFLPSFLFILAGGPLVESTHGKLRFTAPLTAITAAVVGVIASLALFFLVHIAGARHAGAALRCGRLADRSSGRSRAVSLQGRRDSRDRRLRAGRNGAASRGLCLSRRMA